MAKHYYVTGVITRMGEDDHGYLVEVDNNFSGTYYIAANNLRKLKIAIGWDERHGDYSGFPVELQISDDTIIGWQA